MPLRLETIKMVPAKQMDVVKFSESINSKIGWEDIIKNFDYYVAYKVMSGKFPLSLMAVSTRPDLVSFPEIDLNKMKHEYVYLDRLEKYPQAEEIPGIGVISIAQLVKLSQSWGLRGRLILDACLESVPFYEKIGMILVGPRRFIFTPQTANNYLKWAISYLRGKGYTDNPTNPDEQILLYGEFDVGPSKEYLNNPTFLEGDFTVGPRK